LEFWHLSLISFIEDFSGSASQREIDSAERYPRPTNHSSL